MKFTTIYKVRVIYKSGASQDFWTKKFDINNGTYTWESIGNPRPVLIGVDDVAAVWVLDQKKKFYFSTSD